MWRDLTYNFFADDSNLANQLNQYTRILNDNLKGQPDYISLWLSTGNHLISHKLNSINLSFEIHSRSNLGVICNDYSNSWEIVNPNQINFKVTTYEARILIWRWK